MTQESHKPDMRRLKNELASLVSQELQPPLASIKGSLGLILGGTCGQVNQGMRDLLTIAYANSDRLIKLINEILDVSQIEAGQIEMRLEPVDLVRVIEQCVSEISIAAQQRNVLVIPSLEPGLPQVQADFEQMKRALMSLLSNALTYSISGNHMIISAQHHDGWVTVSLRDNKGSVGSDDRQRIVDQLQQAQIDYRRLAGGTGLGLSLCRAIIEQHNGKFSVETAPESEVRFHIALPAVDQEGVTVNAGIERAPAAAGTRGTLWNGTLVPDGQAVPFVLMVDDDPGLRKVVARIVQHSGHMVETADNGEEAIEKIKALHPDLVILDVLMPVLSGFGVVQALRRHPETRDLPLLILTTKDLSDAEKDALRLGSTKFMTKSLVTVESLTAAMNELLQRGGENAELLA